MVGRVAVALLLMAAPAWAQSAPKQAVLDTTAGPIVMDLLADKAPNHVALFIKTAEAGRLRRDDVLSHDQVRDRPGRRSRHEGSEREREVRHRRAQSAEARDERRKADARRGVRHARSPARPTAPARSSSLPSPISRASTASTPIFARVVEGMLAVRRSQKLPSMRTGLAVDRVVVNKVTIRDRPRRDRRTVLTRKPSKSCRTTAPSSTRRWARSPCRSRRTRRRTTCATSCGWRSPVSTTA